MPFSLNALQPTGEPYRVLEVGVGASVSRDGALVHVDQTYAVETLVWRARSGEIVETVGQPQVRLREFSLSPDERSVAVTSDDSGSADIWIQDLERSTATRLTFDGTFEFSPTWGPIQSRPILFPSDSPLSMFPQSRGGPQCIYVALRRISPISD